MPVIVIPITMLQSRLTQPLSRGALVEALQQMGCDVEGYTVVNRFGCGSCETVMESLGDNQKPTRCDACGVDFKENPAQLLPLSQGEGIRMELLAVRPDMFDPGGLGRALRSYLGQQAEPAQYPFGEPLRKVVVAPELNHTESFRPFIACTEIHGVVLDENLLRVLVRLQENLHWALGRDRKRASIGVYDLDTIAGKDLWYGGISPEESPFVPLGISANELPWTPARILAEHPKGTAYRHLLKDFKQFPVLRCDQGVVLSMPPIINSERTKIRAITRNLFIDVTGPDQRTVKKCLNILAANLAELQPKAKCYRVAIHYPEGSEKTPDLTPQIMDLNVAEAARLLGLELDATHVRQLLVRMGYGVSAQDEAVLSVKIPAYRNDILHSVDLVEDIAIAYGYHNIVPLPLTTMTVAGQRPAQRYFNLCREIMTGLGYMEALSLILSSEEVQYDRLLLPHDPDRVTILNPISVEQTMVRTFLLPGLLETLAYNTDLELPQQIFEVGSVTRLQPESETGAEDFPAMGVVQIGTKTDFSEIKAVCETVLREFQWQPVYRLVAFPFFLAGRAAEVLVQVGDRTIAIGCIGELHPQVLENFKLVFPVAAMELDLQPLIDHQKKQ